MTTYHEALAAGLSRREAGYVAAAEDLVLLLRASRALQDEFLNIKRLTWPQVRRWSAEKKAKLQQEYAAWAAKQR